MEYYVLVKCSNPTIISFIGTFWYNLMTNHAWLTFLCHPVYQCNESDWSSDESVTQSQCRLNTEMTSDDGNRSLLLCPTYSCDVTSL